MSSVAVAIGAGAAVIFAILVGVVTAIVIVVLCGKKRQIREQGKAPPPHHCMIFILKIYSEAHHSILLISSSVSECYTPYISMEAYSSRGEMAPSTCSSTLSHDVELELTQNKAYNCTATSVPVQTKGTTSDRLRAPEEEGNESKQQRMTEYDYVA